MNTIIVETQRLSIESNKSDKGSTAYYTQFGKVTGGLQSESTPPFIVRCYCTQDIQFIMSDRDLEIVLWSQSWLCHYVLCVLGTELNLSLPQFPCIYNGDKSGGA